MNNDLISREALKKDFKYRLEKAKNWKENALNKGDEELVIRADATIDFICEVIMTIDNAPTVEAKTTEDCIIAYGDGYETARRLSERPQGEWIFNGFCVSSTQYKCNKCDYPTLEKTNYCPNCGADMRKGGAEC